MKKTSIVVGGTKGIGGVISKHLKLRGDLTYTISRNNSNKNFDLKCDIMSDLDLAVIKKKFKNKKIDNLIFSQRYRGNEPEQDFNLLLRSTNKIIKLFSKNLSKNSSIVVLSSIATTTVLHDQNEEYHYTRGALEGLVKFYAKESL